LETKISVRNLILYTITALIWGSTWLAIKFQLGVVDPIISIFYRFILSAFILILYCFFAKLNLRFSLKEHLFIAFQGFFLFGINYWLVYKAEMFLPSGLVSVVFSMIIFLNVINGSIFLGSPIRVRVLIGAFIGIVGIGFVFKNEIIHFEFSSGTSFAFLLAIIGVFWASFGNILSARNQKNNLPVIQTNAFGMIYGAFIMLILSLFLNKKFSFDYSFSYIGSMLYLAIFGSVIAFSTYLTLLGRIGADRAAYVTLIFPIIALILSTIFEGYQWTLMALIGILLIMSGNFIVLQKKNKSQNKRIDAKL